MLTLDEVHELGTELEMWLRMRVHPIAVKMLKSRDEVPADAQIPTRDWGHKFALCQSFAKSQRDGWTIAMFLEDLWCFEPAEGLGLAERSPFFLEGNHRYPDSVRDRDAAKEWCGKMPHFDHGLYKGIVSAPIGSCSFMPDIILMHVNGMMTSQLIIVRNWIDGKDLTCQLSGHAACIYSVVPAIKTRECTVAIPCKGDRRLAAAQDDEILFTLIPEMLPDFIAGAKHLQANNWGIPMIQEYKEEYDLKPGYKKVADMLGMDTKLSPPRAQKLQEF